MLLQILLDIRRKVNSEVHIKFKSFAKTKTFAKKFFLININTVPGLLGPSRIFSW